MVRPHEMINMLWQPPSTRQGRIIRKEKLDRTLPENSKYYGHWGYTIYRTHYGPESDKQWDTLLDASKRQTMLAVGYYQDMPFEDELMHQRAGFLPKTWYYESQKEYSDDIERIKDLFHLDIREDPSLDGLGVHEIRELCLRDRPETQEAMAGRRFKFVLLADRAVFKAMERGEFVVKAVSYDWEDGWNNWGWMRIPTGYLLALWHSLVRRDGNYHTVLSFDGPEEDLEEYIWPGAWDTEPTSECSEIRECIHYTNQKYSGNPV
ncbi:hypothetical protein BFJ66_g15686 [Fusarium oxysporum f. sp. cepae]|nr:hypothetical protein BFJ65_g14023 [Fusarium oxysporum f. sp. cepae]RKK30612.1 hypothetical protein BFJ67_g15666 [Fusarium oxysporum f. sp. cepae]RKK31772.1 hypothetical protein BFJ66_g15686 [Fusarium oxysporum f. sp. cepae]